LNKDNVAAIFRDTAYAWLKFNDCITGRGFLLKLPFEKDEKMSIYTSALNSFDPKFSVEDGLISYFDHTFVYAQDPQTGKVEKLKLNDSRLDINYDKVHDTFDSVNITRDRIYVKFKLNNADKELEKPINLKP
jgi:hypothetical protein